MPHPDTDGQTSRRVSGDVGQQPGAGPLSEDDWQILVVWAAGCAARAATVEAQVHVGGPYESHARGAPAYAALSCDPPPIRVS